MNEEAQARQKRKKAEDDIKAHRMWRPTEDINKTLKDMMDLASFMCKEQGELAPMLDVVMQKDDGTTVHAGAMFEGVDFSERKEKLKAMAAAGMKMGHDLSDKMVPLQITLMSEAWARPDMDDPENKQEIIMAATRSWDGREGFMSHRIIRDLDDKVLDTCFSTENLAEDIATEKEGTPLLSIFFLGFAIGASESRDVSPELKQESAKIKKKLLELFG